MDACTEIIKKIEDAGISFEKTDSSRFGYDLRVGLVSENVRQFASLLLDSGFYLVYVAGFHVTPYMKVVYEMASFESGLRILAMVDVNQDGRVPTISDIYHGASWHERETRDFFGIVFDGNPDMRPLLLMDTDVDFHPLLKKEDQLKSVESVAWAPEPEKKAAETPASLGAK